MPQTKEELYKIAYSINENKDVSRKISKHIDSILAKHNVDHLSYDNTTKNKQGITLAENEFRKDYCDFWKKELFKIWSNNFKLRLLGQETPDFIDIVGDVFSYADSLQKELLAEGIAKKELLDKNNLLHFYNGLYENKPWLDEWQEETINTLGKNRLEMTSKLIFGKGSKTEKTPKIKDAVENMTKSLTSKCKKIQALRETNSDMSFDELTNTYKELYFSLKAIENEHNSHWFFWKWFNPYNNAAEKKAILDIKILFSNTFMQDEIDKIQKENSNLDSEEINLKEIVYSKEKLMKQDDSNFLFDFKDKVKENIEVTADEIDDWIENKKLEEDKNFKELGILEKEELAINELKNLKDENNKETIKDIQKEMKDIEIGAKADLEESREPFDVDIDEIKTTETSNFYENEDNEIDLTNIVK